MNLNFMDVCNYWDDFEKRVENTIECFKGNTIPSLERLTVHVTNSCNLNCRYCNYKQDFVHIPFNVLERIIYQCKEIGCKIIHFTGGEPSIYPYLGDALSLAKKIGLQTSMNTNCVTRIDCSNVDKLKTSFDSPFEETLNQMMGNIDVYSKIVDNLKFYSKEMKGKVLSITSVLSKQNYKDMLDLTHFVLKEFDIYNLFFSVYKGNDPEFSFSSDDVDELFSFYIPRTLKIFDKANHNHSRKQLMIYRQKDFLNGERFPENKEIPCYLHFSELTIDVYGNLHPCSHLFRDHVKTTEEAEMESFTVTSNLKEMFEKMKNKRLHLLRKNNSPIISECCLTGCCRNLVSFNSAVHHFLKQRRDL